MHISKFRLAIGLTLVASAANSEPSNLEEVATELAPKLEAIESFSADLDMVSNAMGMNVTMNGKVQSKGDLSATDMRMNMMGQNMAMKQVVDSSGTVWIEMDMMGAKQVMKTTTAGLKNNAMPMGGALAGITGGAGGGGLTPNPREMLDGMRDGFDLEFGGRETLNGTDVYLLQGKIRPETRQQAAGAAGGQAAAATAMMDAVKFYVGVNDGFPRRMQMLSADGTPTVTQDWKNVSINQAIADSVFTYSPPPGTMVMDLGNMPGAQN